MSGPIVACILTRDEPQLLRENVLHLLNTEQITHIIVTNHVSIDANKAVLSEFGDYIVHQFDHPKPLPFPQNVWRTQMCRLAASKYNASWMVCTDTDEFWYGLQLLHMMPEKVKSVLTYNIFDHYATRLDPNNPYTTDNLPWHKLRRDYNIGKTIHRGKVGITIKRCSHVPCQHGATKKDPPGIYMHHYPVRDWERFVIKVNTANEGNPPTRRRTVWRKMQSANKLKDHWANEQAPTPEYLNQLVSEGKAGYYIPEVHLAANS